MRLTGVGIALGLIVIGGCATSPKSTVDGGSGDRSIGTAMEPPHHLPADGSSGVANGGRSSTDAGDANLTTANDAHTGNDTDGGNDADANSIGSPACGERIDGGAAMVCSISPLIWVDPYRDAGCAPFGHPGCSVYWGCGSYTTARAAAITGCSPTDPYNSTVTGTAGGYRIILQHYGLSMILAFYDPSSGELVGMLDQDDVGGGICSGTIPTNFDPYESFTNQEILCALNDGGNDAGDAHD